ncbi:oxygen-independent coproporphyrinogen III oxidase [Sulfitobacter sp. S223]|uniref:oxygen-independent coproporphyrinogen III oxidase n=1 Tax=Sulfitobacter sp. S223 TaxID=2867023 RepID=UPI0021A7A8D9|nr:oxygen-independent coproporphyrinogen III oxidase [Sulfitobacter sp. S223]UWR25858.1 oxygen-independent coproporphyrinogen III oxidase [Sulfitobacter sp. S223]
MSKIDIFRRYGLFDARVPRYTSYPPANHFQEGEGLKHQNDWLQSVPDGSDVSVYIHIPFCKRLCWFCACRTQGTKTMRPVDAYVDILRKEITGVRATLAPGIKMSRLHLGGGTPTILSAQTMSTLLREVFDAFEPAENFEFSVEIDPTEAEKPLLQTLIDFGLNRASLGVQDFAPEVQAAIGREQSLEQTETVIDFLRSNGVSSLNLDVLYGLPHQTLESFSETLSHVIALQPDRLAIYGYAHVPWMSKRQVMIREEHLPDPMARFALAEFAEKMFTENGYEPVGIDHFAKPGDSLALASKEGRLHRNFQGYTDDQSPTLLGFGASAISKFAQGYAQNAPATFAYQERINATGFASFKGFEMCTDDALMARVIEDLMCRFTFDEKTLCQAFPDHREAIRAMAVSLMQKFSDVFFISGEGLKLKPEAYPLVRVVAGYVDSRTSKKTAHSSAI